MRERSHTTPRRRGPKQPLPQDALYHDDSSYEQQESPYYTIDNTEDIYSTTLLPSQRCYVDPWDLENYDYVRKKIGQTPPSPRDYYDSSMSPSPVEEPIHSPYYYERETVELTPRMASTMPRKRRTSHFQCQLECCNPKPHSRRPSGIYDVGRRDNYDDYMISHMAQKFQNSFNLEEVEQNIYRGYGGGSTSSGDPHSSIGDDYLSSTMPRKSSNYGPLPVRKLSKPAPKLEFPAPPPSVPPTYDYCNPYATLPCCSVSDCYECLSQAAQQHQQHHHQQLYGSHSMYGGTATATTPDSCYDCSLGPTNSLGRRPSSSLYSGIYSSKFGMSQKGLLQIDYSCSWNDLDRIMTRNY